MIEGRKLFRSIDCESWHRETFENSSLIPANTHFEYILIHPYSDLLLHDMGDDLADFSSHGFAQIGEWRTSPLWGFGLAKTVNPNARYLHDGRAGSIEETILWHDGVEHCLGKNTNYVNLTEKQRQNIFYFLQHL